MCNSYTIKQLEEKTVNHEINCMVWSDRMDLVAISNVKGEVILYRLTWSKAWCLNPPDDECSVIDISWRPDSKILAIAYSSGQIVIVKVEDKKIIHTIKIEHSIACLKWMQRKSDIQVTDDIHHLEGINVMDSKLNLTASASKFIVEPTSQSSTSSQNTQQDGIGYMHLKDVSDLNILAVGTCNSCIHFYIFGCLPITMNLSDCGVKDNCTIIESIHMNKSLSTTFVVVKNSTHQIDIVVLNTELFNSHTSELFTFATKCNNLFALMFHLSNTLNNITETWENILLEMDNKLSKYATKVCKNGVTADFLDLLMFGVCSNEMEEFLMHDLTKKGLEKFGQSIEISYSTIQKLLLKYVTKYGQNVTYHLSELRGMARLKSKYQVMGLSEDTVNDALSANGSFLLKTCEIQQIINHSVVNYKAFFRWLYTAIIHLMDEQIPSEVPKMTQQDLAYITEFVQNFDYIGKTNSKKQSEFLMERVGQYLTDSNIKLKPTMNDKWSQFLSENVCLQSQPCILKHFPNMSLVQQFKHLRDSINRIFEQPQLVITRQFNVERIFSCPVTSPVVHNQHGTSVVNICSNTTLYVFRASEQQLNFVQFAGVGDALVIRQCGLHFSDNMLLVFSENTETNTNYKLVDFHFYSSSILSVLLQGTSEANKTVILCQLPLQQILERLSEICSSCLSTALCTHNIVDGSCLTPILYKTVDGMAANRVAVSGSRRVGLILSANKKRIRLYEMEADEDEDDTIISGRRDADSMQE